MTTVGRGAARALVLLSALALAPSPAAAQDAGLFGAGAPTLRGRDAEAAAPVRGPTRVPVTRLSGVPEPERPARRAAPEADPFAPLGLRFGGLTLRPALTQSGGYDANPDRVGAGARGRAFSRTEGALSVDSGWSRHALRLDARGRADVLARDPDPRLSGDAALSLRLDVRDGTSLTLAATAATAAERASSPEEPGGLARGPQTSRIGASIAAETRLNRLSIGLRGGLERAIAGAGERADGTRVDRSDADYVEGLVAARAGYEVSPGFEPFLEARLDERRFERRVDAAGIARDSRGLTAAGGARFELTRLLVGEASAGWQRRDYEDPALAAIEGVVAEARLLWTPTPLTRVTLSGESRIAETRLPGASGAIARRVALGVEHDLRRDLTLDAGLTLARTDYDGAGLREDLLAATAGLEWRLARTVAIRGSWTHERLASTAPGGGFVADVVLLGVRIAR